MHTAMRGARSCRRMQGTRHANLVLAGQCDDDSQEVGHLEPGRLQPGQQHPLDDDQWHLRRPPDERRCSGWAIRSMQQQQQQQQQPPAGPPHRLHSPPWPTRHPLNTPAQ